MKKIAFIFGLAAIAVFSSCEKKTGSSAFYEGKDISMDANIMRDKSTKKASVAVNITGKWVLYGGPSVDEIDFSKALAGGIGAGIYDLDIDSSKRYYFQLVSDSGRAIIADRKLPMEGGYNFRDLGGIKNKDGKFVKWGKLFRSDDLDNLTDGDLAYLSSIPLLSVVDFRTKEEIKDAPDKFPVSVKNDYKLSLSPGNLAAAVTAKDMSAEKVDTLMMEMNDLLVTDPVCVGQYKEFFKLLQEEKQTPLVFHCSAGKDRTGMAAALILLALNVDEDAILDDYLKSNTNLSGKYDAYIEQYPYLKSAFEVKPEFLKSGISKIKEQYGLVENYLTKELNVDLLKFREMYLY